MIKDLMTTEMENMPQTSNPQKIKEVGDVTFF